MATMITSAAALQAFAAQAESSAVLALDTEFMRERTYYPELCLIQAAIGPEIFLIDALAIKDLSPLQTVLNQGPEKVLHACGQDLEVLVTRIPGAVSPLFDTQIAASLCGYPPQWSYAKMVSEFSQIELPKGATRTDWSRRPLSEAQLDYAADDVRYLVAARDALEAQLRESERWAWFEEERQALQQEVLDPPADEMWRKVKGFAALNPEQLAVLQVLAAWREYRARRSDRPRRWILSDEALLQMASEQPSQLSALGRMADVHPKFIRRHGEEILRLIEEGQGSQPPAWDDQMPDRAQLKALQQALKARAQELQLDPSILATRSDLSALAMKKPCPKLEQGWRHAVVWPALQAAL